MIPLEHILSTEFWQDPGCMVMGVWKGELPDLTETGGSVIFRTSGSTGEGKWLVLGKRALHLSARTVNSWLDVTPDSIWGLALPLRHVGGFGVVARARAATCGLEIFEGKWEAANFTRWVEEKGISHVSLVPTQVHDLLAAGANGPKCLKAVVVGGGKLEGKIGQSARDAGWPVLASYGMTETCSQIATQRAGHLHLPFVDSPLEILPGWETSLSPEGLLRVQGDSLFSGTILKESGAWIFRERKNGWYVTNDRVELAHGTIAPLGRADSMVKIMGELVDIEAVERRFLEKAGAKILSDNFAVVAIPDLRKEHRLIAVFEGNVSDVENAFDAYQETASGLERFDGFTEVETFPRSSMGKLKRKSLSEIVIEKLPVR